MSHVFLITDYGYLIPEGAIAQLGERLHGMQEVGGSIPPGSTTLRQRRAAPPAKVIEPGRFEFS
jgi:hypothetical protein